MKLKKAFQLSFNMLVHSKLRSWLTIIGVVIGIAAVVSIIAVSQGAQRDLQARLGTLGANIITVSPGFSRASGAGSGFRGGGRDSETSSSINQKNLTIIDVNLLKTISNVQYVMGIVSGRATVTIISKSSSVNIRGVDSEIWKNIVTTELSSGRYLTKGDTNSVVLGSRVATSVFTEGVQINRQIIIAGKSFKIVGILKESGSGDDSVIFMPIVEARDALDSVGEKEFNSISIKIINVDLTNDTITNIQKKLKLSRGILQDKKIDFTVTSPQAFQQTISSTLNSLSLFLAAIAAISLIVGAVGIANTMFTSVLEKTKEIGIMKAIGAQNKDILIIFLFNSGLLGLVGGVGGVALGIFGASLIGGLVSGASIGRLSLGSTYFSPTLIAGAFLLSIIVGMIAGAIPAYRASKLKPVEALRY